MIVLPESPPFIVRLATEPLFSVGKSVRLTVWPSGEVADADRVQLDGLVDAFWMLASVGGLSGPYIAPAESLISEKHDVTVDGPAFTWKLEGCRIDERAITSLLNLLRFGHAACPLRVVELSYTGAHLEVPAVDTRRTDYAYPTMAPAPFSVSIDGPVTESVAVSMTLERPPTADQVEEIEEMLLTWSVAPSVGAFAVAGVPVEAAGLVPHQTVDVSGAEVVWSLERVRLHPAAIDSLVNCCVALSSRVVPLVALDVT